MAKFDTQIYTLEQQTDVPEANARGTLLRHKKSGARVFLLENEDPNKVFFITFRTPPANDTGVAHILEHSVLCGSEKYPVKDPFVELAKGSLNTFLNALTYPDKTVYPVASLNDTDFKNLMSVYMDAVLRPNIYHNEKIFRQEGWHYDLQDPKDALTINGVVYNEMKGAFASPDDVLGRYVKAALYPDTAYAFESGGDPEAIPELSYQEFLKFHSTYYHPSNCYIYLYGNADMEERLAWLDREYLSHYRRIFVDSQMKPQAPFEKLRYVQRSYGITPDETEEKKTFLTMEKVVGDALDVRTVEAYQILEYVLLTAPGAPVRQALLDAGIGDDVQGGVDTMRQISFEITLRGADLRDRDAFVEIIQSTLTRLVKEGLDRRSLLAGININEFKAREADYGSYPTGLVYGLQSLDTWLYDDAMPTEGIRYQEIFDFLRQQLDTGYFEELIRTGLLENTHGVVMSLVPEKGYGERQEEKLAKRLADRKAAMSTEQLDALVRQTRELLEYQESQDTKEDLEKIPLLELSDIDPEPAGIAVQEKSISGVPVVHHPMFTGGIGYLRMIFDCGKVPLEDLPWLSLLRVILGYVDTEQYSFKELSDEINIHTGGIDMGVGTWCRESDTEHPKIGLTVVGSALYEKLPEVFRLIREILFHSKLTDRKRLLEILTERKSRAQMRLTQAGHSVAVMRSQSYFSPAAWISEQLGGLDNYYFLKDAVSMLEKDPEGFVGKLSRIMDQVFRLENLLVSYTANDAGYQGLAEPLTEFVQLLAREPMADAARNYSLTVKNEGFKLASQVGFVAQTGSYKKAGFSYTGSMRVLQTILGYDYLWLNLRVKGGAYGCMSGFSREGDAYLVSYRDPNLAETLRVYQGIPDYLEQFDPDRRDLERYIIGTISDLDVPMNPAAAGRRSLRMYLAGITVEDLRQERKQILETTTEDIRALAKPLQAVLDQRIICAVGSSQRLEKEKELFGTVTTLL